MTDASPPLADLARFLAPLRGSPRRVILAGEREAEARLGPDEVLVRDTFTRADGDARRTQRFLRFPGTGGGHVLLDARERAVFRAGMTLLPRGRRLTRLAGQVVRASTRLGLHARLASGALELVEAVDAPQRALHERFAGLPEGLAWNVASGVPGRDQKTIVQLVTRSGDVRAFVKIAHNEHSRALVRREARTLGRLAELGVSAPRSFGIESGEHGTLLVQSALSGERSTGVLSAAHRDYLAQVEERTARRMPLRAMPSHRDALARLGALKGRADTTWIELFGALANTLERSAGEGDLACCLAHGDFTPWNIVVDAGEMRAFDWEHAREFAPIGHDALHFAVQQAVLVDHVEPARLAEHVLQHTADRGRRPSFTAFAAYVLDIATQDETIQLEHRSPFAQVEWLCRARMQLARDLLAEPHAFRERAA